MRHLLKLHPQSRCEALTGIEVEAARRGPDVLAVDYFLNGATGDLLLPASTTPARAEELWRHTCFEAFLRAGEGEVYYEFNFAPSRQWAAYRFEAYRSGMREADGVKPEMVVCRHATQLELQVSLDLAMLANLPANATWRIGLSAVIEEAGGRLSYWALQHPVGKPDFHHAACFASEVPPTGLQP